MTQVENQECVAGSTELSAGGRVDAPGTRREPRRMTLGDLMVVVAGLAVGLVVQPVRIETTRVLQACGFHANVVKYDSVYWTVARFVLPAYLAVGLAVLARRLRFRGAARPAEWLVLVVALVLIDPVLPNDRHVSGPFVTREHSYVDVGGARVPTEYVRSAILVDVDPERSLGQVALGTAILAGLIGATSWLSVRWRLPVTLRTFLFLALAWSWLRVPIRLNPEEVVNFRYSWLTIPPAVPPHGWTPDQFDWYVEARLAVGRWFVGVWLAAVAVTAAFSVLKGGAGRRRWTEWAGAVLALVMALCWTCDELVLRPAPSFTVRATIFVAWTLATGLPALWWVRRFGAVEVSRAGCPGAPPRQS